MATTQSDTGKETEHPLASPKDDILDGWSFGGLSQSTEMVSDDEPTLTTPVLYWEDESGDKVGIAKAAEWEEDGYPFVAVKKSSESWKYTHIAEDVQSAIRAAQKNADRREFLKTSNYCETYSDWVRRTGGTKVSLDPDEPYFE